MRSLIFVIAMIGAMQFMYAQRNLTETDQVFLLSGSDRNELYLESVGIAKKKNQEEARYLALRAAMETVLFKGFPEKGSPLKDPLIPSFNKLSESSLLYLDEFFDQERFLIYFNNVRLLGSDKRLKKYYEYSFSSTLNLDLLRTELEGNGIVRKFGF
ncbi:MAG: hypothetical protein R8G66_22140 [Cytophagales bacterium]|nr:hypothetical protein [Cytophagales bacterium]